MSWETIYRVQDAAGRGPFKPGLSHLWVMPRADHDNLRPWYVEFGPMHRHVPPGYHSGCGCLSIEQLRRWISPGEYSILQDHGYRAVAIKVPHVLARSEIQCFFIRKHALSWNAEPIDLHPVEFNQSAYQDQCSSPITKS